jgi:hypothetical protein
MQVGKELLNISETQLKSPKTGRNEPNKRAPKF